jgi:hypothetical protein
MIRKFDSGYLTSFKWKGHLLTYNIYSKLNRRFKSFTVAGEHNEIFKEYNKLLATDELTIWDEE